VVALASAFWVANGKNPFTTLRHVGDVLAVQLLLLAMAWPAFATAVLRRDRRARQVKREREHREGEKALARASRIVAAGEISLAVAHEINQPLGAILNNAETGLFLLDSPALSREELKAILTDIRNDNLRAAEAIRSIRALLKERERECESVDLNRLIAETVKLLQMQARHQGVAVETVLEPIPLVYADPIQLQQVLLNLLLNALDALKGARIDPYIWIRTSAIGRGRVEVCVADTGSGIPPEHLEKIFEPFYTSKGEGMGLGLSIVRSIIEAHGGKVAAENNHRRPGATFRFELPAVPRASRARRERAPLSTEFIDNG
jgi:signal transduction histidine kinase